MQIVRTILSTILAQLGRLWRYWMQDIRQRKGCLGKTASIAIGLFTIMCACMVPLTLLPSSRTSVASAPTAPPRATEVDPTLPPMPSPTTVPTATRQPTATARPTATTQPTATPILLPQVAVVQSGNLRSAPFLTTDTVIGQLCSDDRVIVMQTREVAGQPWYLVEIQRHGNAVCTGANRATTGSEGWVSGVLLDDFETTERVEVLPTFTPAPVPTRVRPTAAPAPSANCHPSYPGVCIPPAPPDLDCGDIPYRRFAVVGSDPHGFDRDNDGIGCEG